MTEFSGYKAPRRPEYLFLSTDWTAKDIYRSFRDYEEQLSDILENVEIDEEFYVVGEKNGRVGFDELRELAFAGDIDVSIANMDIRAEGLEGDIEYRGRIRLESPGRIEASFEVSDPELEDEIEEYISEHFDSFLGLDLGYNPVRSLK
ncbi:MAG: hypothetical protein ABEK04_04005 [Candidatus Nanohalobium sp.]